MIVVLFYIFLFVFWLENVVGFQLTHTKGLSLLNLVLYMMLVLWLFQVIRKRRIIERCKVNKYIFVLSFVVLLSIPIKLLLKELPNLSLYNELTNLKGWLNPILLFFIIYNLTDDRKAASRIVQALTLFFVGTIITTLGVSLDIFHLGKLRIVQGTRTAGFAEPNQYAAYLVLFLPLLYSKTIFLKGLGKRFLFFLMACGGLVSLFITGSRGGFLSLLFSIGVYIALLLKKRLADLRTVVVTALIVIPILVSTAFLITPKQTRSSVESRFNISHFKSLDDLTSGRFTLWQGGVKLFFKRPILGHGIASYVPLMKKYFLIGGNSHNDYLLYLVHYGMIGLLCFLLVLWSIYSEVTKYAYEVADKEFRLLGLSYIAGFAGYAFAMLGVNIIQPRYFFWIYTAVTMKWGKLLNTAEIPRRKS